ncbi:Exodeoxyribonuclease VII large subunit [Malonomonas rubra DSM 5091]|uniref:Exodeoxyribonuclease 7 large subunit n=1 Tax=Malonomonas rubra DSM 5091 TaxID=1122189 RepID=A0A1M6BBI1_MALRU|nr:exodeoxyribonuclease VII large subunit [Malonomonas rubra]SHI46124.1 Exodeoxyribonuclease VII large subunit [Malonomonas rubra DSM 5091]
MENSQIVTVSALVELLQEVVEDNFVEVLVQGELANVSRPASGHCYFTLKDQKSQLRCAIFRSHLRALRFRPEEGSEVVCRGRVSIYPQRGDLQLIVEGMEPVGVGSLQLAFEQLQQKLAAEGLFDPHRKKNLPEFPQTIGVVTSATGAAIHDILTVLRRRSAGVKVLLRAVRVQGEGAAEEISAAIADLNREASADILIVGRGGGSREDLWAFNEEVVARAIAASEIPIISAVGHEVDISISDLVADLRAATPSAAAELVVQNRLDLERHLDQLVLRLGQQMKSRLLLLQSRLQGLEKRLKAPFEEIRLQRLQLQQLYLRLDQAMKAIWADCHERLAIASGRLDALSPLAVLARGYALVKQAETGALVKSFEQVEAGDRLQIQLAAGELIATVEKAAKKL